MDVRRCHQLALALAPTGFPPKIWRADTGTGGTRTAHAQYVVNRSCVRSRMNYDLSQPRAQQFRRKSFDMATESELDAVSVERGRLSQHEAMAAVMARILSSAATPASAATAQQGPTPVNHQGQGKRKRVEGLGSVEPKTQKKRRKIKVNPFRWE